MSTAETPSRSISIASKIGEFFAGWTFPVAALTVLVLFTSLMLTILLVPPGETALQVFANDFKIWCFGLDPTTGQVQIIYVMAMVVGPMMMCLVIVGVWWQPLSEAVVSHRRHLWKPIAVAGLGVGLAASALAGIETAPTDGPTPFPAESLRTAYPVPDFTLTDHTGQPVSMEELSGRVVLLTSVYMTCTATCPLILNQVSESLDALTDDERAQVSVVAITMDPERDTVEHLGEVASGRGMEPPLYHFATGEPEMVHALLDRLDVRRERDPDTGIITHTNLMLLVDREGRIAFRFSLGERQAEWLTTGLRILIGEPGNQV